MPRKRTESQLMKPNHRHIAEESLRTTGARLTRPRIVVLAVLLGSERALTHTEVESRLPASSGVNRVTIYRVLDWLVDARLAHRITVGDRITRYGAAESTQAHHHAHFQCGRCGTVTCLEEPNELPDLKLPAGYRRDEVDLTVRGVCADCAPKHRPVGSPSRLK